MLYYVFRAHKPCEWSLSSGHGTDVMDQWIHCLVQPDVPPHVPFHKYIHHRLYQMMSCGQIVILDIRKPFLDLSAFGYRTAPGKPD